MAVDQRLAHVYAERLVAALTSGGAHEMNDFGAWNLLATTHQRRAMPFPSGVVVFLPLGADALGYNRAVHDQQGAPFQCGFWRADRRQATFVGCQLVLRAHIPAPGGPPQLDGLVALLGVDMATTHHLLCADEHAQAPRVHRRAAEKVHSVRPTSRFCRVPLADDCHEREKRPRLTGVVPRTPVGSRSLGNGTRVDGAKLATFRARIPPIANVPLSLSPPQPDGRCFIQLVGRSAVYLLQPSCEYAQVLCCSLRSVADEVHALCACRHLRHKLTFCDDLQGRHSSPAALCFFICLLPLLNDCLRHCCSVFHGEIATVLA